MIQFHFSIKNTECTKKFIFHLTIFFIGRILYINISVDRDKAMQSRLTTLNCIPEEMWEKPSFRDAIKNGQRCLIPVTGFFAWRWLDDAGTMKIPYYVTFRDQKLRSMAGMYSRWKDPNSGEYYYSYTLLTCPANSIM